MEWTDAAHEELNRYFEAIRADLEASGADPDEVINDMRRHIGEELSTLDLQIVAQQDVSRILTKMGIPETDAMEARGPAAQEPRRGHQRSERPNRFTAFHTGSAIFFGVVMPIIALGLELLTGICKSTFFDPIPTLWHGLLVGCVPVANILALIALRSDGAKGLKRAGWLTGIAAGVALYYTIVFLPLTPIALIGIVYFGLGLIPMSPLLSLLTLLRLRRKLKQLATTRGITMPRLWRPILAVFAAILLLGLPQTLALVGTQMSGSRDASRQIAGVRLLRKLASRKVLLQSCYRASRPITDLAGFAISAFSKEVPIAERRNIYYRVTGVPYNAVKPPAMRGLMRGALINPDEWDFGQGGDQVSARVSGLLLEQSRMDGVVDADAGTVYTEWTLVFRNDSHRQREARAEIALPQGSVVSRLTLWVDGEEREAAYSGRAKVKAAYKRVVQRRRDPVLVTTSGPDQVLMQCFPVPPSGGTMKTRIGITSPLVLKQRDHGLLRLPYFVERNFGLTETLHHSVWMEAPTPLDTIGASKDLVREQPGNDRYALRGQLSDKQLSNIFAIRADRSAETTSSWTRDHRDGDFVVRQVIEELPVKVPERIIFVIDGSARMNASKQELATALGNVPDGMEFGVLLASDKVCELIDPRISTRESREDAASAVARAKCVGGCDNVPALIRAWDLAAAKPNSAIIWLHATQPIQMQNSEDLLQRWQRRPGNPKLYDLQLGVGPNRVIKSLDGLSAVNRVSNFGNAGLALEALLKQWHGAGNSRLGYRRWREPAETAGAADALGREGSAHIARLYIASEVVRLGASRDKADVQKAVALAQKYQLVTPVSGAVVLENAQQYKEAGLKPANPNDMPAVVPEPETWILLLIGITVMAIAGRRKLRLTPGQVQP